MRREKTIQIEDAGRDFNKRFTLHEMAASQAEEWAARALLSVSQSGVVITPDVISRGFAGLMQVGITSLLGISFADAKPLMAELMSCVTLNPAPRNPAFTRALVEDDIEEVATRVKLKMEVLDLHTGFSIAAFLRGQAARASSTEESTPNT